VKRLASAPASTAEIALLDVRDEAAFAAGHLAGSGHVPLAELEPRRAELPPREAAVVVVAADPDAARAGATELERMGYLDVGYVDAALADLDGGRGDQSPPARLWRPAPFLESVLDRLPRGRAIDLAAGSGREAVFLAMHGFEVEAWDRAPEALERARNLAARHGVRIATTVCNLEWGTPPIEAGRYQVVTCFRFLHRPLFPVIERALAPGGCLVYETYRVGQERFGRPRSPKFHPTRSACRSPATPLPSIPAWRRPRRNASPQTRWWPDPTPPVRYPH